MIRRISAVVALVAALGLGSGCKPCDDDQTSVNGACVGNDGAECLDGRDSSCLDDLVCVEDSDEGKNICVPSHTSTSVTAQGYRVKLGTTGLSGNVYFPDDQTGESVLIKIRTERLDPVTNAKVVFWDGDGFEVFQVDHPQLLTAPKIFPHNSIHKIILKAAPAICDLYDSSSDDNNNVAARAFLDRFPGGGSSTACVIPQQLNQSLRERTDLIIDLSDYAPNGASSIKPILSCVKELLVDLPSDILTNYTNTYSIDCPAYHTWTASLSDIIAGSGNITPLLGVSGCMNTIPEEISYNDQDDDCDGRVDESDTCTPTFRDLVCGSDGNSYWENDCNDRELYEVCVVECDEGVCIDDDTCHPTFSELVCGSDENSYLEDDCGVRTLYETCEVECDEGSCIENPCEYVLSCFDGNARERDSCTGDWAPDIADYCTTAEICEEGLGCTPYEPGCTPLADCEDAGCLLADNFSGTSLEECVWDVRGGSATVSGGRARVSSGSTLSAYLSSFDECSEYSLTTTASLDSSSHSMIVSAGPARLIYDGRDHPNQIGVACSDEVRYFGEVSITSMNEFEIEKTSGSVSIRANGSSVGSISCSTSTTYHVSFYAGTSSGTTIEVDHVELDCND